MATSSIWILTALAVVYVWPVIIAGWRRHPQFWPIAYIAILTGWTGIGLVIALAWSVSDFRSRPRSGA